MAKPSVPFEVHPLVHPSGSRSYVVTDPATGDALVVDPRLDEVAEVKRVLAQRRATLRFVVETHAHGDHLSGAARLHADTGAELVVSTASESRVATRRVGEGDVLPLGAQALRVRLSPGVAVDALVLEGPGVLFTGDTLLVGTIGVRDAPGSDGAALFDTIQRIFEPQADDTTIHPGHDDMGRSKTTVYAEKRGNRWMRDKDRDNFLLRFEADPRQVPKSAAEILAANRDGTPENVRVDAPVGTEMEPDATRHGPVVVPPGMGNPQGMGAGKTGAIVPEGISTLVTLGGLAVVTGTALGFLVAPAFHALSGAVGAGAVVLGLVIAARRPKRKDPGLYYLGPLPRTPMR